jgi:tRNA dimethylallyltransferase
MNASVVLLMGPTATGKTALALDLAEALDGEIISVDSALVYRGMDIGTAKPSVGERARVPHHLIDILDPEETWSAAEFAREAMRMVEAVQERGRVPILVGGTMLYFRALLDGLDAMPEVDPAVRAGLRARLPREGSEVLHAELAQVDAEVAARIHPRDPQRILRALEVYLSTGRTLSSFQRGRPASLPEGWRQLVLWPDDRVGLRERIARRFDAMLAEGFVRELETLRARPLLTAEHASQRAVGYRQGWEWLAGNIDYETFRERAIHATRQLAKRQLTWLRGKPGRVERLVAETASAGQVLERLAEQHP